MQKLLFLKLCFNYLALIMPLPKWFLILTPSHCCIGPFVSSFQSSFPSSQPCAFIASALPCDPGSYKEPQGQGWGSEPHLLSCCCWSLMLLISQPTIPGAICPEAFRLSMMRMFWIRPSALCFMRPWAITGNGQGTSDTANQEA